MCSDFADSEINAIYNYKKIMDERRGYTQPYSATVLHYENKEKTVDTLVNTVTKYFSISQRFYRLHAKIIGDDVLYADKNVKAGEIKKKFSFEESVSIVRGAFEKIDPQYAQMLDVFLADGRIDVYPQKGKSGGAFCWSTGLNPVYILLNHTDDIRSVETLAHEIGHGIHYTLSKTQPSRYRDFSIATAEVASTFFEQVVSAELEHHLSEDEKVVFLHNKIMGDISTIFRQIACFNFELELHTEIRSKGMVPKGDIAEMMAKHMKRYLGKAVSVSDDDGYTFVSWSHIRNFFYVYSYAFGQLVSRALYEKWKEDSHYADKIKQFLSAGRSMSPEDIFKKIGIDVTDPTFFELGLKSIERDIVNLEKLVEKGKKR
jgi:oligoendopeptidase F